MKKTDQAFYDFVLSKSPNANYTQWIEGMHTDFEEGVRCPQCEGRSVKIIVKSKIVLWCKDCEKYSDHITLDNITPKDYNAVTFLHEDKIIDILLGRD